MTPASAGDMKLHTLLAGLASPLPDLDVVDITTDSREAVRDGLFLACRGQRQHGLDFVDQALRAGVRAVAWEPGGDPVVPRFPGQVAGVPVPQLGRHLGEIANRFFASPSARMPVTGITGTNGKTTTAWLVTQASERLGARTGYLGTLGYGLGPWPGAGGAMHGTGLTTPDCISFHRCLRDLADQGANRVVAEVSSHALDQGRVDGVRFATVAFTNLSRDHLDYHASMADYGAAKARLFRVPARTAVINLDDDFGRTLPALLQPGTQLLGVSLESQPQAALRGALLDCGPEGLVIGLSGKFGQAELRSGLWGRFNADNLLLATGILLADGWTLDRIVAALAGCDAPPGRLQQVRGRPGQATVLVDFAHTPDALRNALAAVRQHCNGRIWCVFGCGGDRDQGKRPAMGAVASTLADHVILTDDNPRNEDPAEIISAILSGVVAADRAEVVPDRAAAIAQAIRNAAAGDAVLIAGKGHETVQVAGNTRRHFSDVEVARAALDGRPAGRGT